MRQKNNMKKHCVTIVLAFLFLIGVFLLLYPTISNWLHVQEQSETIHQYLEAVGEMTKEDYQIIWIAAGEYNQELLKKTNPYYLTDTEYQNYMSQLNVSGNGVMAYLEIPKIKLKIPVYHDVEEEILQVAIGHIPGTSLPVGGESTHCVLSGHRGLPSARLFTDLDQLQEGDCFYIHVLNETLVYTVDQVLVTEPEEISALQIVEGKDFCTLITCTPYGINTHRLLIRGCRD